MIKQITGGVIALVIGGTAYTISQSSIVTNFSKETGMSHKQAQTYVNNAQKNLQPWSKIGQGLVSDGNLFTSTASKIDCADYTYAWESSSLACPDGQTEMQTIGNDEVQLGNCYSSLSTNLGNAEQSQIQKCISDIDTVNSDYNLPITESLLTKSQITTLQDDNLYNESVLQAALQSN